ncbi:MAG: type I glyceraldehyde-3-phosphate dehydrogenase, partial [Thermoplasmata archaeon]|nr:type I glyceraldehyde-3-phosphate dehydrogenase [Thermoplasmata archaeon]
KTDVTTKDVNEAFKKASEGAMRGILSYTEDLIVSADIIGDPHSAIIDGTATLVIPEPGKMVKILSWYDNEYGYANRLVDLVSKIL